jgi:hypothetical protein
VDGMICITATEEKFSRKYLDGKWQALQNEAGNKGYEIKNGGLGKCFEFPDSEVDLSMADFLELNDDGFTIHNWPCFLSLDDSLFNSPVPEGLYGRTITDEEGNETILTWAQWGSTNLDGRPILTDGTRGIPLVHNHRQLTNVECAALYGLTGYTLLSKSQYDAMIPQQQGGE